MNAAGGVRQVTRQADVARSLTAEFDAAHRAWLDGALSREPDWLAWAKRLSAVLGKVTAQPCGEVLAMLTHAVEDAITFRQLWPGTEPGDRLAEHQALAAALDIEVNL